MAIQSPSSSTSFSYGFTYQVFLSFRGTDTRHGFTGNLYNALTNKGIHTFIDDNDLQSGDEITPSLLKAIDESRIFIPVFSINYASSSFCLNELVHIIHCYKTKGRLVLPVFFGVEPTNVRHQKGSYGEALAEHEKRFQNDPKNMERLQGWKEALSQAANLSGYPDSPPGYEYKFIGEIVKDISNKISRQPLHVANYPVGLQSRVQQVKSLLDERSDDGVHMVGLYGTGGLGKSTLAKAVYNFIADQFECSCFLENVRENSASNKLKHLQEELLLKTLQLEIKFGGVSEGIPIIKERLCRKKILLIIDDVDNMKQLHALAGGPDWFGRGSKVIITTRDKRLLTCHGIKSMHKVKGLYGTEALELLRWMAFKSDNVPSGYEEILNRAVAYASGLPLVIEIVGSNLFGKSIEEWKYTLDWFEHQSRGPIISFWFRKQIPSITWIFILPYVYSYCTRVNFCVNGYEMKIDYCFRFSHVIRNHTTLFHISKLNELSKTQCEYNIEKGLLKNEWIHVELKLGDWDLHRLSEEEKNKILSSVQMGIHVWNEKSNTDEENVVFTDPYSNNTSLSQFEPPLKKQRLVEVGVSETEEDINASLQQQDLMKEEQRKMWGTFLSLGASKSNTRGDEIEILNNAQDERMMWGTFLGLAPS